MSRLSWRWKRTISTAAVMALVFLDYWAAGIDLTQRGMGLGMAILTAAMLGFCTWLICPAKDGDKQ